MSPFSAAGFSRRAVLGGAFGAGLAHAVLGRGAGTRAHAVDGILNPGFEDVDDALWPQHWSPVTEASRDRVTSSDARAFSGRRSLHVRGWENGAVAVRSSRVPARPGDLYEARAEVLVESGRHGMYLEFWDADDTRIAAHFKETSFPHGWHRVDVRGEAPVNTAYATVMVRAGAPGRAYVDDAAVEPVASPPVERYGPAALTAAVRGVALLDDRLFVASRGRVDDRLRIAEIDPLAREILSQVDLDVGGTAGAQIVSDGRHLYIAVAGGRDIWRYDPATQTATAWATISEAATWAYDLRVEGAHLYLATYPDGTVRRFRLDDARMESYGPVSSSRYATVAHADERHVYGGSASPGRLVRWPLDGGPAHDLTGQLDAGGEGITDLLRTGGALVAACGRHVVTIRDDGGDAVVRTAPAGSDRIAHLALGPDGTVHALTRRSATLYRVEGEDLRLVGRLPDGTEYVALEVLGDGTLVAVGAAGDVWCRDADGTTSEFSLLHTEFAHPDEVHGMLLHSGTQHVWAAGGDALTVHDTASGRRETFRTPGTVCAMAEGSDGTVYAALHPGGRVGAFDDQHRFRELGVIGHGQERITGFHFDRARGQLLVTSAPTGGRHAGALSFLDPATGALDVHVGVLPDQRLMGVAVSGSTAYVIGDTHADAAEPLQPAAEVGAVDLHSRSLLWREALEPSWESYEAILVDEGRLVLMGRRPSGHWFSYDLTTREVLRRGTLGGRGGLGQSRGRVFSWVRGADEIRELPGGDSDGERVVHSGVEMARAGSPTFHFTSNGRETWGVHGTDLARFPLIT